MQQVS
jgi:hypothetical protein